MTHFSLIDTGGISGTFLPLTKVLSIGEVDDGSDNLVDKRK